jgi:hypothetical protein
MRLGKLFIRLHWEGPGCHEYRGDADDCRLCKDRPRSEEGQLRHEEAERCTARHPAGLHRRCPVDVPISLGLSAAWSDGRATWVGRRTRYSRKGLSHRTFQHSTAKIAHPGTRSLKRMWTLPTGVSLREPSAPGSADGRAIHRATGVARRRGLRPAGLGAIHTCSAANAWPGTCGRQRRTAYDPGAAVVARSRC